MGSGDRRTLDLNHLSGMGVELVERLVGCRDGRLQFSGSLHNQCALADLKLRRLLDLIDDHAARTSESRSPCGRPMPTVVPTSPRLELDLAKGEIRTILWATGYR